MKVTTDLRKITAFGGINLIYDALCAAKLPEFINSELGIRGITAKYLHSDIVLALLANSLLQGSFLADIEQIKPRLCGQKYSPIPSADTGEYAFQKLKNPSQFVKTGSGVTHEINYNPAFNRMLVRAALKCKLLKNNSSNGYTLDYDNVVLENNKQDAQTGYTKTKDPASACIGRMGLYT